MCECAVFVEFQFKLLFNLTIWNLTEYLLHNIYILSYYTYLLKFISQSSFGKNVADQRRKRKTKGKHIYKYSTTRTTMKHNILRYFFWSNSVNSICK